MFWSKRTQTGAVGIINNRKPLWQSFYSSRENPTIWFQRRSKVDTTKSRLYEFCLELLNVKMLILIFCHSVYSVCVLRTESEDSSWGTYAWVSIIDVIFTDKKILPLTARLISYYNKVKYSTGTSHCNELRYIWWYFFWGFSNNISEWFRTVFSKFTLYVAVWKRYIYLCKRVIL
jgi:hypothetical protein